MCALTIDQYLDLKQQLIEAGYADEIDWAEGLKKCQVPCQFVREYIFVVVNSGMKAQIARGIFNRVMQVIERGYPAGCGFGHDGKASAIDRAVAEGIDWWIAYIEAEDKLAYLKTLPWIGDITKYHLGKNLGLPVAKPDRHLARLAGGEAGVQPMCERLSEATGDSVVVVDTVIWRAANLGLV